MLYLPTGYCQKRNELSVFESSAYEVLQAMGYRVKADIRIDFTATHLPKGTYHSANFSIDSIPGKVYQGFTQDDSWNGWECPVFTFETAIDILNDSSDSYWFIYYDDVSESFVAFDNDGSVDTFSADLIDVNGSILIVYPIGARSWIWELAA